MGQFEDLIAHMRVKSSVQVEVLAAAVLQGERHQAAHLGQAGRVIHRQFLQAKETLVEIHLVKFAQMRQRVASG